MIQKQQKNPRDYENLNTSFRVLSIEDIIIDVMLYKLNSKTYRPRLSTYICECSSVVCVEKIINLVPDQTSLLYVEFNLVDTVPSR